MFFEPKQLYRSSVEEVPDGDYEIELGKARFVCIFKFYFFFKKKLFLVRIVRQGNDVTIVGYGSQVNQK